ncbi:hypothetical protein BFN03_09440 [Rhodococcus sp. WMMA185]|nr:hypothetical protein [Rhodococcus sp. WMMA185]AOW92830.1 hypothetical protein BFN03_09440 [Rhodococcus sp. WMMA185]
MSRAVRVAVLLIPGHMDFSADGQRKVRSTVTVPEPCITYRSMLSVPAPLGRFQTEELGFCSIVKSTVSRSPSRAVRVATATWSSAIPLITR